MSVCVQGKDVEKGKNIEDSGHKRDALSKRCGALRCRVRVNESGRDCRAKVCRGK